MLLGGQRLRVQVVMDVDHGDPEDLGEELVEEGAVYRQGDPPKTPAQL